VAADTHPCCTHTLLFRCELPGGNEDLPSFPHDALPICIHIMLIVGIGFSYLEKHSSAAAIEVTLAQYRSDTVPDRADFIAQDNRSEEHTSELQSRENLVCRLLLEKKKTCCSTCRPPAKS